MIKDGFLYLAALIFAAAVLVNLPKIFKILYMCKRDKKT